MWAGTTSASPKVCRYWSVYWSNRLLPAIYTNRKLKQDCKLTSQCVSYSIDLDAAYLIPFTLCLRTLPVNSHPSSYLHSSSQCPLATTVLLHRYLVQLTNGRHFMYWNHCLVMSTHAFFRATCIGYSCSCSHVANSFSLVEYCWNYMLLRWSWCCTCGMQGHNQDRLLRGVNGNK